jgi:hypothetical protein
MATTYELWDLGSGNVIGAYGTEAAALATVATAIQRYGADYADCIALIREDSRGRSKVLAEGAALAGRAQQAVPEADAASQPTRHPTSA